MSCIWCDREITGPMAEPMTGCMMHPACSEKFAAEMAEFSLISGPMPQSLGSETISGLMEIVDDFIREKVLVG